VFWKPLSRTIIDTETGDEQEDERFFVLRYFTVFSGDQIEGVEAGKYQVDENEDQTDTQADFAPAEELIVATGADIRYGGDRAYYARPKPDGSFPHHTGGDYIVMPPRTTFAPPAAFYETASDELAHWTEPRVGFHGTYALGELVAEVASCYVAAELGIPQGEGLGNHAAYVRHWLDAMRGDRNFIFKAAKQASKVTDYLLSFVRKPEPEAVATG
jgi:antirestriction protein ArdC